jgi:hypothetical protein
MWGQRDCWVALLLLWGVARVNENPNPYALVVPVLVVAAFEEEKAQGYLYFPPLVLPHSWRNPVPVTLLGLTPVR